MINPLSRFSKGLAVPFSQPSSMLNLIELHQEVLGDDADSALELPHPPAKALVFLEGGEKTEAINRL